MSLNGVQWFIKYILSTASRKKLFVPRSFSKAYLGFSNSAQPYHTDASSCLGPVSEQRAPDRQDKSFAEFEKLLHSFRGLLKANANFRAGTELRSSRMSVCSPVGEVLKGLCSNITVTKQGRDLGILNYRLMSQRSLDILCLLSVIILPALWALLTFDKLAVSCEGWFSVYAEMILDGRVPYRDFELVFPPLYTLITTLIISVFGQGLLPFRVIGIFLFIGLALVSYHI